MLWRGWLALGFVLGGFRAVAEPPIPGDDTIQYVLQRGDSVIASTDDGLYRASVRDKVWHKMDTPDGMPAGGRLAEQDEKSPRLVYYTGMGLDFPMIPAAKGSLYLSPDDGKTWSPMAPPEEVEDVFLHPDGSIYAATEELTNVPFPPGGNSVSVTAPNGTALYPHVHLKMTRDDGKTWQDITPPVRAAFGLWGLFRDPDHPDLVCIGSNMIMHTSMTLIYQAADPSYHWTETRSDKWHDGKRLYGDWWGVPMGNSSMMATLDNFFKFPFPRKGGNLELPAEMLETDKPAYRFHLHDFMFVTVTSRFLLPEAPLKVTDMKDETAFWRLRIQDPEGRTSFAGGRSDELNTGYPDLDARRARYANDPYLITQQIDQANPYQRQINLGKFYDFKEPGKYRAQLTYGDGAFDRKSGCVLGSEAFEIDVIP